MRIYTFFIGDNGTGKSTLIETLAYRRQLPQLDSSEFNKRSFAPAISLAPHLEVTYAIHRSTGFFFRAEDFGDFINSVDRRDASLQSQLESLRGEVPEHIIQEMKDNADDQLWRMRSQYGQDLQSFSHGEAYLKIIHDKIQDRGIYILDEPEAALSPSCQLSLIYFIVGHLQRFNAQFIIATHSPMLMAIPGARIYEITENRNARDRSGRYRTLYPYQRFSVRP